MKCCERWTSRPEEGHAAQDEEVGEGSEGVLTGDQATPAPRRAVLWRPQDVVPWVTDACVTGKQSPRKEPRSLKWPPPLPEKPGWRPSRKPSAHPGKKRLCFSLVQKNSRTLRWIFKKRSHPLRSIIIATQEAIKVRGKFTQGALCLEI